MVVKLIFDMLLIKSSKFIKILCDLEMVIVS